MQVNWRWIHAARNTYAVLSAACGFDGFPLKPVDSPADDVTCYSLNSINVPEYRDEIATADCRTIVGGPHATACPREVAGYADYVVVGEGPGLSYATITRAINILANPDVRLVGTNEDVNLHAVEKGKRAPLPGRPTMFTWRISPSLTSKTKSSTPSSVLSAWVVALCRLA